MSDPKQTKFEEDLQAYFPDIYQIHVISKWDKCIWDVWSLMMKMVNDDSYGSIVIDYRRGHISKVSRTEELVSNNQYKPYLNHPGVVDDKFDKPIE